MADSDLNRNVPGEGGTRLLLFEKCRGFGSETSLFLHPWLHPAESGTPLLARRAASCERRVLWPKGGLSLNTAGVFGPGWLQSYFPSICTIVPFCCALCIQGNRSSSVGSPLGGSQHLRHPVHLFRFKSFVPERVGKAPASAPWAVRWVVGTGGMFLPFVQPGLRGGRCHGRGTIREATGGKILLEICQQDATGTCMGPGSMRCVC